MTTPSRADDFKAELADMGIKDPATARDRVLLRLGATALVVGVTIGVVAYFGSTSTSDPLEQRDWMILAVVGAAVTVAGAALFVRYSIAQFLRFWLARLIYEQRAQTDRVVGLTDGGPAAPVPTPDAAGRPSE